MTTAQATPTIEFQQHLQENWTQQEVDNRNKAIANSRKENSSGNNSWVINVLDAFLDIALLWWIFDD